MMRIVTHTCSNTEIVAALGAADQIVGVDDHSDFPPAVVQSIERIGPDLDVDPERIKALNPDLIITSLTVPGHERCLAKIQETGIPYLVTQPQSLQDVIDDIERIGQAIERPSEAKRWGDRFYRKLAKSSRRYHPIPLLIEWWPKPVIAPGKYSWVNEMLTIVGAVNPWVDREAESVEISSQDVMQAQVQGIIMSWCGVQESKYRPHVVKRRSGWAQVPAIINHHIYPISEAWLGRPGPRLLEGIDRLAEVVTRIQSQP